MAGVVHTIGSSAGRLMMEIVFNLMFFRNSKNRRETRQLVCGVFHSRRLAKFEIDQNKSDEFGHFTISKKIKNHNLKMDKKLCSKL
jgi:hypothetical protein